jgi:uncharacterized protein YrrD
MPVINVNDGAQLGEVEDVLLDTAAGRVGALKVASGGLLRREHAFIPYAAIQSLGEDAVLAPDGSVLHPEPADAGHRPLDRLCAARVVTEDGRYVGDIVTAHFDPRSGAITGYEVGPGGLDGLLTDNAMLAPASVMSFAEDLLVVPDTPL